MGSNTTTTQEQTVMDGVNTVLTKIAEKGYLSSVGFDGKLYQKNQDINGSGCYITVEYKDAPYTTTIEIWNTPSEPKWYHIGTLVIKGGEITVSTRQFTKTWSLAAVKGQFARNGRVELI